MSVRRVIGILLLAAFAVWLAWYISDNAADFRPLADVSVRSILALAVAFIAILAVNGLCVRTVAAAIGRRVDIGESVALSSFSSFANYFLPFRGGAGFRAVYLARVHAFPISTFVSTLGVMYLMHVAINASLALAGIGLARYETGEPVDAMLVGFFGCALLGAVIAMLIRFDTSGSFWRSRYVRPATLIIEAWQALRSNRAAVLALWGLMVASTALSAWQCAVAFDAVSVPVSAGGILVYAAAKNLATLISITPGAIGIVEIISIYLGTILGYTTSDALLVQALLRAIAVALLLVAGPISLLRLRVALRQARSTDTAGGAA